MSIRAIVEGKNKSTNLDSAAAGAACGFLLVRGAAGAAQAGAWDMPAALGSTAGAASAALLFLLGCAAVCVLRGGCSARVIAAVDVAVFILYAVTQACRESEGLPLLHAAADGALVLAGYMALDGSAVRAALLLPLALRIFAPMVPVGMLAQGRITAVFGGLSSAGMTGAALCGLCREEERRPLAAVLCGAAAAVLIRA